MHFQIREPEIAVLILCKPRLLVNGPTNLTDILWVTKTSSLLPCGRRGGVGLVDEFSKHQGIVRGPASRLLVIRYVQKLVTRLILRKATSSVDTVLFPLGDGRKVCVPGNVNVLYQCTPLSGLE